MPSRVGRSGVDRGCRSADQSLLLYHFGHDSPCAAVERETRVWKCRWHVSSLVAPASSSLTSYGAIYMFATLPKAPLLARGYSCAAAQSLLRLDVGSLSSVTSQQIYSRCTFPRMVIPRRRSPRSAFSSNTQAAAPPDATAPSSYQTPCHDILLTLPPNASRCYAENKKQERYTEDLAI